MNATAKRPVARTHRGPKPEWIMSEVAPFIRRILRKWATDAERTAVAHELAEWLEANGDRGGNAKWLRHPKMQWIHRDYGISYSVHPWDNKGHGSSCRIDTHLWAWYYPAREFIQSKQAAWLVGEWLKNRVAVEGYPWTRDVAQRIGMIANYDYAVKQRAESREQNRLREIERQARRIQDCVILYGAWRTIRRDAGFHLFADGDGI